MFTDRLDAGHQLADALQSLRGHPDLVVLGLPRGGVPVAAVVAETLDAPLDVIIVRKLGLPSQPELAMGALGEDGGAVLNDDVVRAVRVTPSEISMVKQRESAELMRRSTMYRQGRDRIPLAGRIALIIDDGVATGSTARAACRIARAEGADQVILAVPVAPEGWTERMAGTADTLISVTTPAHFVSVGQFYDRFDQTSDREVVVRLAEASTRTARSQPHANVDLRETDTRG